MNQPCDRCKAVRPFSGDPPKCTVCGWEFPVSGPIHNDAASLPKTDLPSVEIGEPDPDGTRTWTGEQKVALGLLLRVALWGILIVAAVVLAVQFLAPGKRSNVLTESRYGLALKYHLLEEDVDMDPKPAGCSFTDAPVGEKHCHFEQDINVVRECLTPNCPVKHVYVSWHKVRDPS